MKFSETVKLTDPNLAISKRHDAWLAKNDHPQYSGLALSFAQKVLTAPERKRKGTVSASSLGECRRYQQFVFLGMPKLPPEQKNAMKMHNGSFMHLRWQMAGLTEGWLKDAEVPVHNEQYGLIGTMDGLVYDGSICELKSINLNGFRTISTFGPLTPHLFQMATYMLCTGRKTGRFIYECKDNQEYKEIPVRAAEMPIWEAKVQAELIWQEIGVKRLFEPLNKCIDKTGWKYNSCPFKDRCLAIHEWEEAT